MHKHEKSYAYGLGMLIVYHTDFQENEIGHALLLRFNPHDSTYAVYDPAEHRHLEMSLRYKSNGPPQKKTFDSYHALLQEFFPSVCGGKWKLDTIRRQRQALQGRLEDRLYAQMPEAMEKGVCGLTCLFMLAFVRRFNLTDIWEACESSLPHFKGQDVPFIVDERWTSREFRRYRAKTRANPIPVDDVWIPPNKRMCTVAARVPVQLLASFNDFLARFQDHFRTICQVQMQDGVPQISFGWTDQVHEPQYEKRGWCRIVENDDALVVYKVRFPATTTESKSFSSPDMRYIHALMYVTECHWSGQTAVHVLRYCQDVAAWFPFPSQFEDCKQLGCVRVRTLETNPANLHQWHRDVFDAFVCVHRLFLQEPTRVVSVGRHDASAAYIIADVMLGFNMKKVLKLIRNAKQELNTLLLPLCDDGVCVAFRYHPSKKMLTFWGPDIYPDDVWTERLRIIEDMLPKITVEKKLLWDESNERSRAFGTERHRLQEAMTLRHRFLWCMFRLSSEGDILSDTATFMDVLRYARSVVRSLRWTFVDAANALPTIDCAVDRIFHAVTTSTEEDLAEAFGDDTGNRDDAPSEAMMASEPSDGLRGYVYNVYFPGQIDAAVRESQRLKAVRGVINGHCPCEPPTNGSYTVLLRGFFRPRASGLHVFFVTSKDYAYVWMSDDSLDPRRALVGIDGLDDDRATRASPKISLTMENNYPFAVMYSCQSPQPSKALIQFTDPISPDKRCDDFTGCWFSYGDDVDPSS